MPKDSSSSNDELLGKAVGGAVGWTVAVSAFPLYYLAKGVWRGLVFTGLWPLLALLFLFALFPSPHLSFPILFAFMFSIFWTGKNLVGLNKAPPVSTKKFDGVFFGAYPDQHKNPSGKTVDKDGHILVVGGAGSGKSAYVAIPTLRYFWGGRFLAVDIKGELAQKSGRKEPVAEWWLSRS